MPEREETVFAGFDTRGEVRLGPEKVIRGIRRGNGDLYRSILDLCTRHDLFRHGIVGTRIAPSAAPPHDGCELHLEHDRVPFISYPHEWPASMLKRAALFHLDLALALAPHSLIIKDFHPWNILFCAVEPVFVDFTALLPAEMLVEEDWLRPVDAHLGLPWRALFDEYTRHFYQLYRRMFRRYFEDPLRDYRKGLFDATRRGILESTMNAEGAEKLTPFRERNPLRLLSRSFREVLLKGSLLESEKTKPRFLRKLRCMVDSLSVDAPGSGYLDYYGEKGEELPLRPSEAWKEKQHVVYRLLRDHRPSTILDLGANTGWFSRLAASMGSRVVAIDVDEGCVQHLASRVEREKLDILPLVVDFLKPSPDIYPDPSKVPPSEGGEGGKRDPLLLAAEKRLRCDMVMALALVHHLALGSGIAFREICDRLAPFAGKQLMVEFVALDDELIRGEPEFFPAYHRSPGEFGWYTLEGFIGEAEKRLGAVSFYDSHPRTRKMLLISRER